MGEILLSRRLHDRNRTGVALVLALLFLSIFAALAVVFATVGDLSLHTSHNFRLATDARLAAESGLAYCVYVLESQSLPKSADGQEMLNSLATALSGQLNGTANLGGQSVSYDGTTIVVPAIAVDDGASFHAEITVTAGKTLLLTVVGQVPAAYAPSGVVARTVSVEVEAGAEAGFGYGMFAKGPVGIGENFDYIGANDSSEASLFSAADGVAISVDSGSIDGDVIIYQPTATVSVGATVGGDIYRSSVLPNPQIDPSVFEPFATTIVDASWSFSSGTFTNIRIRPGTNPEFGNDVVIRGVMYIEAPNRVTFTNNCTITGVIVSEDPGEGASAADHFVYFKNNLTVHGFEELPDDTADGGHDEFPVLRTMGGSAFLLPGFRLEFKNNFSSLSGTVAAHEIIAKNNLAGTVYGSIIVLGNGGLIFKNNSTITIDRSRYPGPAPGITGGDEKLVVRFSSYGER